MDLNAVANTMIMSTTGWLSYHYYSSNDIDCKKGLIASDNNVAY